VELSRSGGTYPDEFCEQNLICSHGPALTREECGHRRGVKASLGGGARLSERLRAKKSVLMIAKQD
jgi:hypothetical protein